MSETREEEIERWKQEARREYGYLPKSGPVAEHISNAEAAIIREKIIRAIYGIDTERPEPTGELLDALVHLAAEALEARHAETRRLAMPVDSPTP